MQVGESIKHFREETGITQYRLAKDCKLAPSTISQIEDDKRQPTLRVLWKIADRLDVSLDKLVGREKNIIPYKGFSGIITGSEIPNLLKGRPFKLRFY